MGRGNGNEEVVKKEKRGSGRRKKTKEKTTHLLDIDPSISLSIGMSIPQFRNDGNRVQTRILCQCRRDDFKSFCESLETVGFFTLESMGVLCQES